MEMARSAHELAELLMTSQASYALPADGSTVEIRQARPRDAADVRQMHDELSPTNSYFRFFSNSPLAPERRHNAYAVQRTTRTRRCWPGWTAGW
jgi:hypothetical protein